MCEPVTLTSIAIGTAVLSGAASGYAQYKQGQAASDAAQQQADPKTPMWAHGFDGHGESPWGGTDQRMALCSSMDAMLMLKASSRVFMSGVVNALCGWATHSSRADKA